MTWTKKYEQFARSCNFSQSMEHLARWKLRRAKLYEPSEIEIDLRDFNSEVEKDRWRGAYHRKTLITAMSRLDSDSNGMFTIMKKYSPWVYKVLVRPLSFLAKLESAKCASTPKQTTAKPMFDADHKKRRIELLLQNISKLDSLFQKLGMKYSHDALLRIWRMAGKKMSEVEGAIEYMLAYHTDRMTQTYDDDPSGVTSPKGFLHQCLKYSWHHFGMDEINLPILGSIEQINSFVRGIMPQTESPPNLS